ncbi:MAG: rhomboid family intramembrane serine protease, partial [Elusimicrobiota bacterium]
MIPLRDDIPHEKKPIFTTLILVANILVFIYELSLGKDVNILINSFGFIPNKFFSSITRVESIVPVFTSMFLHGGFLHVGGNCLFLWIFADNVEDRLGHFRFFIFYILCGVAAALIHG